MARVDPELEKDLAGDPARRIEVIVTASTDLKDLMAALGNDVRVTHVYRLIRGVAATASAASIRRLAANQAVASIEPVRKVKHTGRGHA
jgi:hypothetical protein